MKPTEIQIRNGTFKYVDRILFKRCTGPAHEEPEYLPATEKYFHFHRKGKYAGQPLPRCRLCVNWNKIQSPGSHQGYVSIRVAQQFFVEATNRIGAWELAQRTGLSPTTIRKVLTTTEGNIRKTVLRKVMLELTSIQRKREYSISNGAKWRARQRLFDGYDVCAGCGTPKTNISLRCSNCYERYRTLFKDGTISENEWSAIKWQLSSQYQPLWL